MSLSSQRLPRDSEKEKQSEIQAPKTVEAPLETRQTEEEVLHAVHAEFVGARMPQTKINDERITDLIICEIGLKCQRYCV